MTVNPGRVSRETQMAKKEAREEIGKQRKIKIYTSEMTCETKKRGVSRGSQKTEDEPHPGSITNKRLNCVRKERERKKRQPSEITSSVFRKGKVRLCTCGHSHLRQLASVSTYLAPPPNHHHHHPPSPRRE